MKKKQKSSFKLEKLEVQSHVTKNVKNDIARSGCLTSNACCSITICSSLGTCCA